MAGPDPFEPPREVEAPPSEPPAPTVDPRWRLLAWMLDAPAAIAAMMLGLRSGGWPAAVMTLMLAQSIPLIGGTTFGSFLVRLEVRGQTRVLRSGYAFATALAGGGLVWGLVLLIEASTADFVPPETWLERAVLLGPGLINALFLIATEVSLLERVFDVRVGPRTLRGTGGGAVSVGPAPDFGPLLGVTGPREAWPPPPDVALEPGDSDHVRTWNPDDPN